MTGTDDERALDLEHAQAELMAAEEEIERLQQDVTFLVKRARAAGSVTFTDDRWTGISSNVLVDLAYGGTQDAMPYDRSDYAACVRTVRRLPRHRRTQAVMHGLRKARDAYLSRYPERHSQARTRR